MSWSRVGLPDGFVETLHATRGVLIAAEFGDVISVSTDGTTWEPFTAGFGGEYVSHLIDDGTAGRPHRCAAGRRRRPAHCA